MIAKIVRVLVAGSVAFAIAGATPAGATETAVIARGTCSGESHWRLGLATDGEKIWVGYRVDAPVPGEIWRVRIIHGDDLAFAGRRIATEPDGIFGVRLAVRNLEGPDLIRARAFNTVTGETCAGRAAI